MKSFFVITLVLLLCLCHVGVTQAVAVSKEAFDPENIPDSGKLTQTEEDKISEIRKQILFLQESVAEITRSFSTIDLVAKNPSMMAKIHIPDSLETENELGEPEKTRRRRELDSPSALPSSAAEQPNLAEETPTSHNDQTNTTESRGDAAVRPVGNVTSLPGVIYIRWGNDVCPEDAELIYSGSIGGARYTHTGSGSNYLCMPDEPIYDEVEPSLSGDRALLYSSEYQVSHGPSRIQPMHDQTPTCAVCRAPSGRTSKLMIPARNVCPSQEWRLEYAGYLMAQNYKLVRTEFVCVDREMVPKAGTIGDQNGVLLHMTEVRCQAGDGLDCGPYIAGYEITCAVCTI